MANNIEWMCTVCGKKEPRPKTQGRPAPGKCSRKTGNKPHSWTKNKEF
ncbi:MAG: hypothetical protein ACXAHE_21035 [Roseburia sp. 1XD42-69]